MPHGNPIEEPLVDNFDTVATFSIFPDGRPNEDKFSDKFRLLETDPILVIRDYDLQFCMLGISTIRILAPTILLALPSVFGVAGTVT